MENQFSTFHCQGFANNWPIFDEGFVNDGASAAASTSKSHSEAEKRRRDRINGHLHTLRKLTPNSEQMDKAALLANVVQRVKELKIKAAEVCRTFTIPSDVNEVKISIQENNSGCISNIFIEVCICCEDRPELYAETIKVLQSLKLSIVHARMASLGGRVKIALLISSSELGLLNVNQMRTLRANLNRVVNSTPSVSSYRVASRRQRFFCSQADS